MVENVELGTGQVELLPVQRDGTARGVHVKRSARKLLFILRHLLKRGDAAENRTDARRQDFRTERLCYIIVRTEFQTDHDIAFLAFGGQHDDRNMLRDGIRFQIFADGKPVHSRKHQVKQNQVRFVSNRALQGGLAVFAADRHQIALPLQIILDQFLNGFLILDDHDSFFAHGQNLSRLKTTQTHGIVK